MIRKENINGKVVTIDAEIVETISCMKIDCNNTMIRNNMKIIKEIDLRSKYRGLYIAVCRECERQHQLDFPF